MKYEIRYRWDRYQWVFVCELMVDGDAEYRECMDGDELTQSVFSYEIVRMAYRKVVLAAVKHSLRDHPEWMRDAAVVHGHILPDRDLVNEVLEPALGISI